jgi:hypothetical protein
MSKIRLAAKPRAHLMVTRSTAARRTPATGPWDFFIAYPSPERAAALELHSRLDSKGARVFLDKRVIEAGATWDSVLESALKRSRITLVLVSPHTPKAWYQREEIAIAIALARDKGTAYCVVPVVLPGWTSRVLPYGLNILNPIRVGALGLGEVASRAMAKLKQLGRRPGTKMLGRAAKMLDEIWSGMEPALVDKPQRMPEEFRIRFQNKGDDLVLSDQGKERIRITPRQFKQKLDPSQLQYVETLERSMELNLALWEREYPRRSASRRSKIKVTRAVAAMAEDFNGLLTALESAGFWLDDHYQSVRQIAQQALASHR